MAWLGHGLIAVWLPSSQQAARMLQQHPLKLLAALLVAYAYTTEARLAPARKPSGPETGDRPPPRAPTRRGGGDG